MKPYNYYNKYGMIFGVDLSAPSKSDPSKPTVYQFFNYEQAKAWVKKGFIGCRFLCSEKRATLYNKSVIIQKDFNI